MAWAEADFYRGQFSKSEVNHLLRYLAGEKKIPLVNWWRFIRRAPEVWLVNVFDLARPPIPDLLVLAHQSPEQMMQEIRSRGEALEPWENEAFLTRLDQAYRDVGQVLQRRRRVRLLELDMSAMSQAEAAELIVELAHEGRAEPATEVPPRA